MSLPLSKWAVTVPPDRNHDVVWWNDVLAHLRLDLTTDASYVKLLIDAATDYAQDNLAMSLMPQTITAVFNAEDVELSPPIRQYQSDPFSPLDGPLATSITAWGTLGRSPVVRLPRGPVSSIVSVVDANNNTITGSMLERTPAGDRLRFTQLLIYPVIVTYTAGYPNAAAIPAGIRVAILTHIGTLYANRESANAGGAKVVPHSLEDFYRLKSRRVPTA